MRPHGLLVQLALVAAAEGNAVRWMLDEKAWFPARETAVVEAFPGAEPQEPPAPTSPPQRPDIVAEDLELFKRQVNGQNTCGYVSGLADDPITCATNGYCFKVLNTISSYSYVGCCSLSNVNDCAAETTCLELSQSQFFSGSTAPASTLWCSDPDYPNCLTYSYGSGSYSGYVAFGCAATRAIETVFWASTVSSTSSSSSTTTSTSSSTTTTLPASSSTPTTAPCDNCGGTPVGAIAGGVVGGVAVIAIAAGIIICLFIRSRKKKEDGSPTHPPPEKPSHQSMQQVPAGGAYVPQPYPHSDQARFDPRSSVASPTSATEGAYPPSSYHGPYSPNPSHGSPEPPLAAPYSPQPSYGPGNEYAGAPAAGQYSELDVHRGDGEMYELGPSR